MKRLTTIFVTLTFVFTTFVGIYFPSLALARGHRPPPKHHYKHHYYYRHHRDHHHYIGRALATAFWVTSLSHALSNTYQQSYTPEYNNYHITVESPEARYEREKALFIYKMDDSEKRLWDMIRLAPPGDYFYHYGDESADGRRVKKFAEKLYKDIKFEKNDKKTNTVYFTKLSEAENE